MKEKLGSIFGKVFNKKVFNKKTITTIIVVVVIAVGLKIGYESIYEVEGTIQKVDGKNITVANFFTTKTVNIGDYTLDTTKLQAGEKISIHKNLSGDIISIRGGNEGAGRGGRGPGMMGKGQMNGQRQTNGMNGQKGNK